MYPSPAASIDQRVSAATMDMIHTMVAAAVLAINLFATAATAGAAGPPPPHNISSCLLSNGVSNFSLPSSPSFTPLLCSSIRYLRFEVPSVGKPVAVVFPASKQELQRAVVCARNTSLAIRVRSGGHSYEGLSYTTENHVPFVVIDLANLNAVHVDATAGTVWAESGATLGELYHAVGVSNRTLAFPGGTCPTVGLGGIISGGGFGPLARKFGLAADNVLDAVLIDPSGNALSRATMDGDVFWAIRGGGGGSFGVVYSWTLRLVPVPEKITVLSIERVGPPDLIAPLIHKWQYVGPHLPDEFYIATKIYFPGNLNMTITGQFLVPKQQVMAVLNETYPELRLAESELSEVSSLEAAAISAVVKSVAELTDRQIGVGEYAKRKSDYTQAPISEQDMAAIARYMSAAPTTGSIQLSPYGAAMARIGSTETPFPHRAGYLYSIQYAIDWKAADNGDGRGGEFMAWLREFCAFMAPHVSSNPRGAYVNYIDLDLGTNNWTAPTGIGASNSYNAMVGQKAAATWGQRYFLHNFDRLVRAKAKIDPENVFNNAQSIPPSL